MAALKISLSLLLALCAFTLLVMACGGDDERASPLTTDADDPADEIPDRDHSETDENSVYGLWLGTWSDDGFKFEQCPASGTLTPALTFTPNGNAAIVTTRRTYESTPNGEVKREYLYLMRQKADGTWQRPLTLAAGNRWNFTRPAVLADRDGRLHVLFARGDEAVHLLVAGNQVREYPLAATTAAPHYFSLAQAPTTLLHAVFGEYNLSHQFFYGDGWVELASFPDASYPQLVFDPTTVGNARLVFLRYKGISDSSFLLHFVWENGEWRGEPVLEDIDFYPVPHLAVDAAGRSHILAPSSEGLLYLTQDINALGGWRKEVVASDTLDVRNEHTDLAVDQHTSYVAFRDARTARGYLAVRNQDLWSVDELAGFEPGFIGMELGCDGDGAPHLVFAGSRLVTE